MAVSNNNHNNNALTHAVGQVDIHGMFVCGW